MTDTTQSETNKLPQILKLLFILAVVVGLGVVLAQVLISPDWSEAVTYVGISSYITTVLVNPLLGFLLWISTSPFSRFWYLNISLGRGIPDLSLDRIAASFIMVLLLAKLAIRKRFLASLTLVDLCIVLFLIGTGLSLPLAIAGPRATLQAWFDAQIVPIVVYFLAKNLISNKKAHKAFLITLTFMATYLSFLVIHEQLTGNILFYPQGRTIQYTAHIRRVVGLLGNPAFFAIILGMLLPFMIYQLLESKNRRVRFFYALLNAGLVLALFLCYNRAGWVAALLVILFMAIFYRPFRKVFLVLLLLAAIATGAFWESITGSYVVTERLTAQSPIDYRMNAIDVAWRMVSSNLVFGRGYGNFGYLYAKYAQDWTQTRVLPAPHNTYMNILVSAGLAGFIPYVAIFVAIFGRGIKLWKRGAENRAINRPLLICMLSAVIVYASTIFFSDIVGSPYVTVVFFFIIGAELGYQERASRWGTPKEWLV
jgi:hypothetical protein